MTDDLYTFQPLSPATGEFYRAGANSETNALVQWAATRMLQSASIATSTFDYKSPREHKVTDIPAM
ncbi:hypothetical protein, partial [Escherichia coli]|uniref:hypothetical protein n=1 Tax=Escherichia coli TaxID=562 RepID=UPI0035A36EF9